MDAGEFVEWQLEYAANPWGEERDDLRAGIIASVVANRHRGKKEPSYEPKDFMPKLGDARPRRQSPEEMKHVFRLFTLAAKGTIVAPKAS